MSKTEVPGNIRLWAAVVLSAVFVIGAACGAALWHVLARPNQPPPMMMGPIPIHELDLTPDQKEKAHAIFETYRPEIDAVLEDSFPKVRAVIDKVDKDLMDILTDEQKERFKEIKSRRPDGPGGMAPGGMPPGGMPPGGMPPREMPPRGMPPDMHRPDAPPFPGAPPVASPPGEASRVAPRDPEMEAPAPGGGTTPDSPPPGAPDR